MPTILQTPTVYTITPFDPQYEHTIEFYYSDNQPYQNRIVVADNETGAVVYDKTSDSMRLYAVIPADTLEAGKQYLARIQIFDFDGNSSILSDPVLFHCFTTPDFRFENIEDGQIYKNAGIDLNLSYFQAEQEPLTNFQYFLYSSDNALLSSSGRIYASAPTRHSFYGLKNKTAYRLRAAGETAHGMLLDTGYVEVFVEYNTIPTNVVLKAENNYENGYIQLATNIIRIEYELKNDQYQLENGLLTLEDNYLLYNEGLEADGDFALFIEAKELPPGRFFTTNDNRTALYIVNICGQYYCRLEVKDSSVSCYAPLPKADALTVFEVKRRNGIYSLKVYCKTEKAR